MDDKGWYKTAQCLARVMMMVRNVSFSYRDQYAMSLPGFMPTVGNAFGQTNTMGLMSPGLDFAFGLIDDGYIDKAKENDWLISNDNVTNAATSKTEDLQIRATLEPVKNLKIDLNASRTETVSKSVQYVYEGNPTTQSGTFTMTTLSIGSSFESMGDANNGYYSSSFEKFVNSLESFRGKVQAQYPESGPRSATAVGEQYGEVNKYSADVMIPAFLNTYTSMGGNGLKIFPSLASVLDRKSTRLNSSH